MRTFFVSIIFSPYELKHSQCTKCKKPENTEGKNNSGKKLSELRATANMFWGCVLYLALSP